MGVYRLNLCLKRIMWSLGGCVWDQRRCEMYDGGGGAATLDICHYVLLCWVLLWGQGDGQKEKRQGGAGWNVG